MIDRGVLKIIMVEGEVARGENDVAFKRKKVYIIRSNNFQPSSLDRGKYGDDCGGGGGGW